MNYDCTVSDVPSSPPISPNQPFYILDTHCSSCGNYDYPCHAWPLLAQARDGRLEANTGKDWVKFRGKKGAISNPIRRRRKIKTTGYIDKTTAKKADEFVNKAKQLVNKAKQAEKTAATKMAENKGRVSFMTGRSKL